VSRYLLGPVMLAVLVGIGLYGAFCVNVKPTVLPVPSPTVVLVLPPTSSPTVFVFSRPSPSPDIFTVPRVPELILATPLPAATVTPTAVPPTSTPGPTPTAVVPMRQRG
jgi:hypothetical protein